MQTGYINIYYGNSLNDIQYCKTIKNVNHNAAQWISIFVFRFCFLQEKQTVTAKVYLSILIRKIISLDGTMRITFQQDRAPAHTTTLVKGWLNPWLQKEDYEMSDTWPGNSLSYIIDNVRILMKRR